MNKLTTNIILFLIWLYQKTVSQFLPPACRFSPSCSNYMLQAINQYGVGKGIILGVKRIFKCHPFSKTSGWDPVK